MIESMRRFVATGQRGRFWVLGPVTDDDWPCEMWGVVDGLDLPGQRSARKPPGFQEFWPSEEEANAHRDALNAVTEWRD
jgi:hypothetical protein